MLAPLAANRHLSAHVVQRLNGCAVGKGEELCRSVNTLYGCVLAAYASAHSFAANGPTFYFARLTLFSCLASPCL